MIKQNAIVHLHMRKKGVYKHMNTFMQLSWSQSKRKGCKCFDCQHETSIIHPKLTVFISDVILIIPPLKTDSLSTAVSGE